jgi:cytochrome c biogenesis protein CcmG, thiol:disulfide interchange protein DsbE
MTRKLVVAVAGVLLVVVVVAGLLSARSDTSGAGPKGPGPSGPSLADARAQLKGAPEPLAALHAQGSELLGGGAKAFTARLTELRGYPVVVNKWGSWCGPCREEFPTFQRMSARYGKRIAFLGVDGQDNAPSARKFLKQYPVSYPSYVDDHLAIAKVLQAVQAFPSTVFYDRRGRVAYIKQGLYPDQRTLAADLRRYAR